MTGENLGHKPGVAEYSPFSKVFNKGLDEKDKKKDFWKDLKILKIQIKIKQKS